MHTHYKLTTIHITERERTSTWSIWRWRILFHKQEVIQQHKAAILSVFWLTIMWILELPYYYCINIYTVLQIQQTLCVAWLLRAISLGPYRLCIRPKSGFRRYLARNVRQMSQPVARFMSYQKRSGWDFYTGKVRHFQQIITWSSSSVWGGRTFDLLWVVVIYFCRFTWYIKQQSCAKPHSPHSVVVTYTYNNNPYNCL